MKIDDLIVLASSIIIFGVMIYLSVRLSSKDKRKARRTSIEALAWNDLDSDKFFQVDSTYYSYNKPFIKRLIGLKGVYSPYCERCHKSVRMYWRMLGISVSENVLSEVHTSGFVKSLLDQDWSVLNNAERPDNWSIYQPIIFISLGCCKTCDGPFHIVAEVRGWTGKSLIVGGGFSREIDKKSALALLEMAIDRNLISNNKMYATMVGFCKDLGSSKDFAQIALAHERKKMAMALGNRGLSELDNGILDKAEENLNSALKIFEDLGEKYGQAKATKGLARVYYRRNELYNSEDFIERSLNLFEELHDKSEMAICYGFLGQILFDRKEFCRAERLVWKALEIDKAMGNKRGMAMDYHALGAVNRALEKRGHAKDAYAEALKLYKELDEQPLEKALRSELDQL